MHVNPLTSSRPHFWRSGRVSYGLQLTNIWQGITLATRKAQCGYALAVLAYAPKPYVVASNAIAVGSEAIPHGSRFLDDGGSRIQWQEVEAADTSGLKPHVGNRLATEVNLQNERRSPGLRSAQRRGDAHGGCPRLLDQAVSKCVRLTREPGPQADQPQSRERRLPVTADDLSCDPDGGHLMCPVGNVRDGAQPDWCDLR